VARRQGSHVISSLRRKTGHQAPSG